MDYKLAKEKLPDWTAYCSEQLKSDLKVLVLREYLSTHNANTVMNRALKEIKRFTDEIDDDGIAKNFFTNLSEFVAELIESCRQNIGSMSAYQVAMALRSSLTEAQKRMLPMNNANQNQATFKLSDGEASVLAQVAQTQLVPEYSYNRATSANTFNGDVQKQVKEWLAQYKATDRPKNYIYSSQERGYAEMNIRYNAYLKNKQSLQEQGVKLILVPSHANCSERCQPYQGRVYSLDGTSGTIDGRKYIPIEDVSDKVTYTSPKTGKTYFAGLFSYNCRHRMEKYEKGMNIEIIPADVIERQRSLEEQQRLLERTYRKGREEWMILNEIYKKSKDENIHALMTARYKKNVMIRKQYVAFCNNNNLVEYRERLKIIGFKDVEEYIEQPEQPELITIKPPYEMATTIQEAEKALKDVVNMATVTPDIYKLNKDIIVDNVNQLQKLETKFGMFGKEKKTEFSLMKGTRTYAYVGYQYRNTSLMELKVSSVWFKKSKQEYFDEQKEQIESGWFMPCNEDEYLIYTITHEYGHAIQNMLVFDEYEKSGWDKNNPLKFVNPRARSNAMYYKWYTDKHDEVAKRCKQEIIDIAIKNNPQFDEEKFMSAYSHKNEEEFFAECFANSQLSKPNELGIAMNDWLKQKGLIKNDK